MQLCHIAVGDAVDGVVGAFSVIAEGLIFIRPRGKELDQGSPTSNDRPTFYVPFTALRRRTAGSGLSGRTSWPSGIWSKMREADLTAGTFLY